MCTCAHLHTLLLILFTIRIFRIDHCWVCPRYAPQPVGTCLWGIPPARTWFKYDCPTRLSTAAMCFFNWRYHSKSINMGFIFKKTPLQVVMGPMPAVIQQWGTPHDQGAILVAQTARLDNIRDTNTIFSKYKETLIKNYARPSKHLPSRPRH